MSNGYNVHNHYKEMSLEDLNYVTSLDRLPFSVMCLNLTGDMNIGVICRMSHLMGAESFYVFGRRKVDNRPFVGSEKYIHYEKIDALDDAREQIDVKALEDFLTENSYFPIFCEQGGHKYDSIDWGKELKYCASLRTKPLFVFGNEGKGIPKEILDVGGSIISIPQRGVIRSYNVSSAASIIISHVVSEMTKANIW